MPDTKTLSVNPRPKDEFLTSALLVKAHKSLIERADFQNSLRTAQAQYTRMMCALAPANLDTPNQLQASAMCFQRIQGMNDFVSCLLNLAEVPRQPAKVQSDNLTQH